MLSKVSNHLLIIFCLKKNQWTLYCNIFWSWSNKRNLDLGRPINYGSGGPGSGGIMKASRATLSIWRLLTHVNLRTGRMVQILQSNSLQAKKGCKICYKKMLNVVPMYHKIYWTENPYLVTSMALAQLGQIHDEQLSGLQINNKNTVFYSWISAELSYCRITCRFRFQNCA